MASDIVLQTDRLLLRQWRPSDLQPFAALNADPRVMEFFPNILSRDESDFVAARISRHLNEHGFGLWAAELRDESPFIGFVGIAIPSFSAAFTPCIEIGWRLAYEYWGRGFATEAATGVRDFAFERLNLDEIVSFTVPKNQRSRRVMEKLGMTHSPADDFDHPILPAGDPFQRHVLYRLSRDNWRQAR